MAILALELHLKFEGTDGQTTTVDSSPRALTVTRNGSVELDTGDFRVGASSSQFPADGGTGTGGGTDFWEVAANANLDTAFWDGDWTLKTHVKFEIDNAGFNFFFSFVGAGKGIQFHWNNSNSAKDLTLHYSGGTAGTVNIIVDWEPVVNTWYKIECRKTGTSFRFFIDNVQQGSTQTGWPGTWFVSLFNVGSIFLILAIKTFRIFVGVLRHPSAYRSASFFRPISVVTSLSRPLLIKMYCLPAPSEP